MTWYNRAAGRRQAAPKKKSRRPGGTPGASSCRTILDLRSSILDVRFRSPVTGREELGELSLGRAGLGAVVVVPADHRRQRHEDRFDPPAGLQAEERPAVV